MSTRRILLLCVLGLAAGCGRPAGGVKVFAAASTQNALDEIVSNYKAKTGVSVECEFAASSTLARQIEQGAPADLFLSADWHWANYLDKKGLVDRYDSLLTNRLVVAVPADSKLAVRSLADLAGDPVKRLAIGGEAVPAGRYARKALKAASVLGKVESRFLEGKDVSAVLLYVARGEAEAGFVYVTDAAASSKVRVAYEVPVDLTGSIDYPLVRIRRDRDNPAAEAFIDYLESDAAGEVFRKAGFGQAH